MAVFELIRIPPVQSFCSSRFSSSQRPCVLQPQQSSVIIFKGTPAPSRHAIFFPAADNIPIQTSAYLPRFRSPRHHELSPHHRPNRLERFSHIALLFPKSHYFPVSSTFKISVPSVLSVVENSAKRDVAISRRCPSCPPTPRSGENGHTAVVPGAKWSYGLRRIWTFGTLIRPV